MKFPLRRQVRSDCEAYRYLCIRAFQESSASFSERYEEVCEKPVEFFQALLGDNQ